MRIAVGFLIIGLAAHSFGNLVLKLYPQLNDTITYILSFVFLLFLIYLVNGPKDV